MLTPEHLRSIREHELELIAREISPGASVLEIGAGTGWQALELSRRGFRVSAIDLSTSAHAKRRVYPITDYDGCRIPHQDASFDVVFSSNVLEHVRNFAGLMKEITRVLKPKGYCVHTMPTPIWRFWHSVTGYADLPFFLLAAAKGQVCGRSLVRQVAARLVPVSHGKTYPSFVELWTYRRMHWMQAFARNGFQVLKMSPMGLFYTGWSVFGASLDLRARARVAAFLGSACTLYVVKPIPCQAPAS
jgi:2-polyprenyl-3-methyl-5-hydroxy-6-metoxy-1,4-benzoquinol methylase